MSVDDIAAELKVFVAADAQVATDDTDFTCDVHLFESGYLDSLGLVRLIAFIETKFDVQLDETQLFSEEFTTVNGIASLIAASLPADWAPAEATTDAEPETDRERQLEVNQTGFSGWLSKMRAFGR